MRFLKTLAAYGAALAALLAGAAHANAGERYAVVVANENYAHTAKVDYAKRDADAIENMLVNAMGFSRRNITRVNDATLGDMRALFGGPAGPGRLTNMVRGDDSELFIYFAGHGSKEATVNATQAEPFLMGVDSRPDNLRHTGFKLTELIDQLQSIRSRSLAKGRVTLVLESCFSGRSQAGEFVTGRSAPAFGAPIVVSDRIAGNDEGFTVLAAARGNEFAVWDRESEQSVFTDAFVSGMFGEADQSQFGGNDDGNITLREIKDFVGKRIAVRLQSLEPGVRQQPDIIGGSEDEVLVSVDKVFGMPAQMVKRRHSEKLRSGSLLARANVNEIKEYLRTCLYCPRQSELRTMMRKKQRQTQVCAIESTTVDRLLENGTEREIELFLGDSECTNRHEELRQRVAVLNGDVVIDVPAAPPVPPVAADQQLAGTVGTAASEEILEEIEIPEDLAYALQAELARVGCLHGKVDGIWGNQSRRALQSFASATEQSFENDEPSGEAYVATRSIEEVICEGASQSTKKVKKSRPKAKKKVTKKRTTKPKKRTTRKKSTKKTAKRKTTRKKKVTRRKSTRKTAKRKTKKRTKSSGSVSISIGVGGGRSRGGIRIGVGSKSKKRSRPKKKKKGIVIQRQCERYGNFCG